MTTVSDLHEQAMNAADVMFVARRANRRLAAERAALEAFGLELRAASMAFDLNVSIRTRLILLRSMVSLAREAHQWSQGMDLVVRALSLDDLRPFRDEVLHSLDILRTYQHLELQGIHLGDSDVQLTVAGPEAAPDFARIDHITNRIAALEKLMARTSLFRMNVPWAARIPRSLGFRSRYFPFISNSRAASFAVTIRFGVDEQQELDLEDVAPAGVKIKAPPTVSRVLDDIITYARAYTMNGPAGLRRVLKNDDYAKSAAGLLREMSPDASRISAVGLTVYRGNEPEPVALPERDAFDARVRPVFGAAIVAGVVPSKEVELQGELLEGDARKRTVPKATIVMSDGHEQVFFYDEASHGDVVDMYWKKMVRITLRRDGRRFVLDHIDPA